MGLLIEGLTIAIRPWVSFPISLKAAIQVTLSVPCIIICLLGMIWFHRTLNLVKVNLLNEENKLVTHGPFNYVRHPLYAALLLTVPPLLVIWFSDLLFIIPWVIILIVSHYVVLLEERELMQVFGAEYADYRRFVPALLPYKGAGGRLLDSNKKQFIDELLPRDVVARAINEKRKDGPVFLDVSHLGEEFIQETIPQEAKLAKIFQGRDSGHPKRFF